MKLRVEGDSDSETTNAYSRIKVNGIRRVHLKIHTVKNVLLVPFAWITSTSGGSRNRLVCKTLAEIKLPNFWTAKCEIEAPVVVPKDP